MRMMNKIIMTLAGLLLVVAAGLKFHEIIATCVPSWRDNPTGFWESYEFFLVQIPLEFALGAWLLSGLFRKVSWIAGMLAFFGFIFVTIFKIVTGAESCGCFGQIPVNPRITLFVMDIPIFLMLAIFHPKGYKLLPPPWPNPLYMLTIATPVLAVMALAAPAMIALQPECIKAEPNQPNVDVPLRLELARVKQQLQQQKQEVQKLQQQLEQQKSSQADPKPPITIPNIENPETNPNPQTDPPVAVEQWDWLQFIVEDDVRRQLSEGLVTILSYHHDCPSCAEMVPAYSEYYREMAEQGVDEFKIAFLAMPPYAENGPVPGDTPCILGTLTDEKKWGVMSPYVVALLDGELIKTWEPGTAPEPENILKEVFGQ